MPKGQGQRTVKDVMRKFKGGSLHSGSSTGPVVTRADQAIAIALKEAGLDNPNRQIGKRKRNQTEF